MMRRSLHVLLACGTSIASIAALASPAAAQMQLPGALNGNADGAPKSTGGGGASTGGPTPAPPRPIVIKPPAEDTILGHALSRDGKSGTMTFDKSDDAKSDDLVLRKLTIAGDKISRPQDTCTVDVDLSTPVPVTPRGRPAGTLRYDVALAACPFTIDVLDGAVLVSRAAPSCDFKADDCRVTPGGLWGPTAADITPKQVKDLEHQRARIETTMRANYRALVKKAGKDRAAVKAIARDQAAFSSEREMTCRDYDKEAQHGFCSTQITEARALALLAQFGPMAEKAEERRHARKAKAKPTDETPPAAADGQ